MFDVIIAAAGSGNRSQLKINKNLFVFDGRTVIERTVGVFLNVDGINNIIVAVPEAEYQQFSAVLSGLSDKIMLVTGKDTRTETVKSALLHVTADYVIIHDGARPFVTKTLIESCMQAAAIYGAATAALPPVDTIGKTEGHVVISAQKAGYLNIQTPQVFDAKKLKAAYEKVTENDCFTDDSGVYCKYAGAVAYVAGEAENIKLTYKKDFESLLPTVYGCGFDLHRLVPNRKLVLCGVNVNYEKGLLGHSDADAPIHALMDAMLSACGMKDIGFYFPDTDPAYKDISSMILLEKVLSMTKKAGYKPVNVTICIMAEKPKLSPLRAEMTKNIAKICNITPQCIGITFTTLEGVGAIGNSEAIAAYATCTLKPCL